MALRARLRALFAPLLLPASSRAFARASRVASARARPSPESAADGYSSSAVPSADSRRSRLSSGVSREGLASAIFGSRGRFQAARLRSHSRASTSVRSTVARGPLKRNLLPIELTPGATRRERSGGRRELCGVQVTNAAARPTYGSFPRLAAGGRSLCLRRHVMNCAWSFPGSNRCFRLAKQCRGHRRAATNDGSRLPRPHGHSGRGDRGRASCGGRSRPSRDVWGINGARR